MVLAPQHLSPDRFLRRLASGLWWRAWGFCLSLLLAMGLTGCQPATSATPGVTQITLWHGISPPANRQVFQSLVADFNAAHPDIQVESLYVGQPDQQIPKILTAIVGDAAPDLLWYVPQITGRLVELEAIQPLEDWLGQSAHAAQLDPALLETMALEGHLWSVPFATNNAAVFYRPSRFAVADIKALPKTWDEFRQAARRLTEDTDGDGRSDRYGLLLSLGKGEWTVFVWLPWVYSAGGWLQQNGQPDLVNAGAIAALDFAQSLVQDGSVQLSAPERGYEIDAFLTGKVAMQITGPWILPQLQAAGIDYGVLPFPTYDSSPDTSSVAVLGGENFFLCHTTPAKTQAALQFLDYVLGADFQLAWATQTGYLPINLNVRSSDEYQAFLRQNPSLEVFLDQMPTARSRPIILGYPRLSENFGRAIEASLLGQDPHTALQTAQQRLNLISSHP